VNYLTSFPAMIHGYYYTKTNERDD